MQTLRDGLLVDAERLSGSGRDQAEREVDAKGVAQDPGTPVRTVNATQFTRHKSPSLVFAVTCKRLDDDIVEEGDPRVRAVRGSMCAYGVEVRLPKTGDARSIESLGDRRLAD